MLSREAYLLMSSLLAYLSENTMLFAAKHLSQLFFHNIWGEYLKLSHQACAVSVDIKAHRVMVCQVSCHQVIIDTFEHRQECLSVL